MGAVPSAINKLETTAKLASFCSSASLPLPSACKLLADFRRTGMIFPDRKGASWAVTASHLCVRALYVRISRGHVSFEHATSLNLPSLVKKVLRVMVVSSSTASFHMLGSLESPVWGHVLVLIMRIHELVDLPYCKRRRGPWTTMRHLQTTELC